MSSTHALDPSSISCWLFSCVGYVTVLPSPNEFTDQLSFLGHAPLSSPLLSPSLSLSWSSLDRNHQQGFVGGGGQGFTAASAVPDATSLALRSVGWNYVMMLFPLKHFHREMPGMLTVRWNRDLLLQGLQKGPDLAPAKTLRPPNCFCKSCSARPNQVEGCFFYI